MDVYILDKDLEIIGIMGAYESIIWGRRLSEPGAFKAVLPFGEEMNWKLRRGNLLYIAGEEEPAVITRRYLRLDRQGMQTIQVQGYMASRYLAQRIVWNKLAMEGTPEQVMQQIVYENVISPEDSARKMERITLGRLPSSGRGSIRKQVTYDNVQEAVTAIAKTYGLGYKMRLDVSERRLYFDVYAGADRTAGSGHPCIFSRDFNNVFAQDYYEDEANYSNVCLVGGTGEGDERVLAVAGEARGHDRREMFYNASGISGEGISGAEYGEQLRQKGMERLSCRALVVSFENKIDQGRTMEFGLGDQVTCTDSQWGITIDAQVTAIERGYGRTEESCIITLGNQVPTLVDLIKARG